MESGSKNSRGWLFTVFPDDTEEWHLDDTVKAVCKYWAYQRECCPTTKREHVQGYLEFKCQRTFDAVKAKLPPGAHIEARRGTPYDAWTYCCKEDTRIAGPWHSEAEPKGKGHRSDIDAIGEAILNGGRSADIALERPGAYIRNWRGIERLERLVQKQRSQPCEVSVFWGPTGTGKSRQAYEEADGECYVKEPSHRWWDGYTGQRDVIIDDYTPVEHGGGITSALLLRWLDRYPCIVETKGGTQQLLATRWWITSNWNPENWLNVYHTPALMRRITCIREFTNKDEED